MWRCYYRLLTVESSFLSRLKKRLLGMKMKTMVMIGVVTAIVLAIVAAVVSVSVSGSGSAEQVRKIANLQMYGF